MLTGANGNATISDNGGEDSEEEELPSVKVKVGKQQQKNKQQLSEAKLEGSERADSLATELQPLHVRPPRKAIFPVTKY